MILSRGRRYVFVHIPKTGGTALSLALEARAMKDDLLIGDTPKARARKGRLRGVKTAGRVWKHSALAEVIGLVTEAELDGFMITAMVRNPWDRAVSYYHWLRAQGFANQAVGLAKSHDFSGFLNHPRIMSAFRLWPAGAYVRRAAGVEWPCRFLRLEHFAEDVAPFEAHLGFRLVLPRVNESARQKDWRVYYSDADAALLADCCAEDIARFGYRFDP